MDKYDKCYNYFCCFLCIVTLIVIFYKCITYDNEEDKNCCTCCNECIKDGDQE